jgi:hypothetical protein
VILKLLPGFVRQAIVAAIEAELNQLTGGELDALMARIAAAADKKVPTLVALIMARVTKLLKV